MQLRIISALAVTSLISSLSIAQSEDAYEVPRNEFGQPDFQEVWSTRFNTMLERPEGMPLVLPPEMAQGFAQAVYENGLAGNTDPDIDIFGAPILVKVKGEFRSSVIVHPENGILPYNEHGIANSSYGYFGGQGYDGPEQRPGVERCIEAWGSPPMRAFAYQLFHGFVQTPEKIAIVSEENSPLRVIHMDGSMRPEVIRTMEGHSVGSWEGDTLVVETTHFSDTIPE